MKRDNLKILRLVLVFGIISNSFLLGQRNVIKVNFLESLNLDYNASAPTLVKYDQQRKILGVANANSSTFTVINTTNNSVNNIPIDGRAVQHLKDEALTFSKRSGSFYLIGNKSLFVIYPGSKTSFSIKTEKQYEMVAVDENTGNAFLVGRESKNVAVVNIRTKTIDTLACFDIEESLLNLNQTPPPPIRKVITDNILNRIIAYDGYTSTLFIIDPEKKSALSKRKIELESGARLHYAGYNEETHFLYVVVETDKRKVIQCAKIDIQMKNDVIVDLPEFSEGVGINYNAKLDEVYIPYDNFPSVHVVEFADGGSYSEIKIPLYGNDASAVDEDEYKLYVASWAYGEVEIIDLWERKFVGRIANLGIIPHTFTMEINPNDNILYVPIGATAVNGAYGAAITSIDTDNKNVEKIYTGWTPVDLLEIPDKNQFAVINNEDQIAFVNYDGSYSIHTLPYNYPNQMLMNNLDNIYISYGPHQSYWPTVYIWGAKNGIMQLDPHTKKITDRRIPRLSHRFLLDQNGALYALQNTWGKEKQFITVLEDEVREFTPASRLEIEDEVERETIQRILKYDEVNDLLFLVKVGETDTSKGLLQVIDKKEKKIIERIETGLNPTDLIFDEKYFYIANFNSNTLTRIDRSNYKPLHARTGKNPFKMVFADSLLYVINHGDNSLQEFGIKSEYYTLPVFGYPNNIKAFGKKIIITSHNKTSLFIYTFDTETKEIEMLYSEQYPYGDVNFDNNNSAFYLRGQWGDSVFELTKIDQDKEGRIWITDYLSGKLYIIDSEKLD